MTVTTHETAFRVAKILKAVSTRIRFSRPKRKQNGEMNERNIIVYTRIINVKLAIKIRTANYTVGLESVECFNPKL